MFLKYLTGPNAGTFARVRPGDLIGNRSDCARIIDDIPKDVLLAHIEQEGANWFLVAHDRTPFSLNGDSVCHAELRDKDLLSFFGSVIKLEVISPPARGAVVSRLSLLEVPLLPPERQEHARLEVVQRTELPLTEELPVAPGRAAEPASATSVDAGVPEEKGGTTVLTTTPEASFTAPLSSATTPLLPQTVYPTAQTPSLPALSPEVAHTPWLRITVLSALVGAGVAILTLLVLAPMRFPTLENRPSPGREAAINPTPSLSVETTPGLDRTTRQTPAVPLLEATGPTTRESEQRPARDLSVASSGSRQAPTKADSGSKEDSRRATTSSKPERPQRTLGSIDAIAPVSVIPQPAPAQARLTAAPVDVEIRAMEPNTSVQFDNRPPGPTPLKLYDIPVGRHQLTLHHSVEGLKNPLSVPITLPESARPIKIMLRLKARTLKINQEDAQRIEVP